MRSKKKFRHKGKRQNSPFKKKNINSKFINELIGGAAKICYNKKTGKSGSTFRGTKKPPCKSGFVLFDQLSKELQEKNKKKNKTGIKNQSQQAYSKEGSKKLKSKTKRSSLTKKLSFSKKTKKSTLKTFSPGDSVKTIGLTKTPKMNGIKGKLEPKTKWKRGKVSVTLETRLSKPYNLNPKNLEIVSNSSSTSTSSKSTSETFSPGDSVKTKGLTKTPKMNGIKGKVEPKSKWKSGKVSVTLETRPSKPYNLNPENLELVKTENKDIKKNNKNTKKNNKNTKKNNKNTKKNNKNTNNNTEEYSAGDIIEIVGFTNKPKWNGTRGTVEPKDQWEEGKIAVKLDTDPPKVYSLLSKNLKIIKSANNSNNLDSFSLGDIIEIVGFTNKPKWNGTRGIVEPKDQWEEGKVAVKLETDPPKVYSLLPENLSKIEILNLNKEIPQPIGVQPPPEPEEPPSIEIIFTGDIKNLNNSEIKQKLRNELIEKGIPEDQITNIDIEQIGGASSNSSSSNSTNNNATKFKITASFDKEVDPLDIAKVSVDMEDDPLKLEIDGAEIESLDSMVEMGNQTTLFETKVKVDKLLDTLQEFMKNGFGKKKKFNPIPYSEPNPKLLAEEFQVCGWKNVNNNPRNRTWVKCKSEPPDNILVCLNSENVNIENLKEEPIYPPAIGICRKIPSFELFNR